MNDLAVLQAVRLKGRIGRDTLASTLNVALADVTDVVDSLVESGLLVDGPALKISPGGRTRLAELLAAERTAADSAVLAAVYDEFRSVNVDFKALVTDWQLNGGKPNTHADAGYDTAVLARLHVVHQRVMPIIEALAIQLPRLGGYATKLAAALDHIKGGETAWLTRPLIDSYHTVWFELHEELILAIGLTRAEAAKYDGAQ